MIIINKVTKWKRSEEDTIPNNVLILELIFFSKE